MAAIGTALGYGIFGSDAFGKRLKVPALGTVSPGKIQAETLAENKAALEAGKPLAADVNAFNAGQMRSALKLSLPGMLEKAESITKSQMRGEVPEDVSRFIEDRIAAQNFGGGFAGAAIGKTNLLRSLGLTSLQIQQQGMSNFGTLAGLLKAPTFDITSMFYTPQQRLGFAVNERDTRFNASMAEARAAAAPDPFAHAMTQAFIQDEEAVMEMAGSALSMMAAGGCWLAREVFGKSNPKWKMFRVWLFSSAPDWFRKFYIKHGPNLAAWVRKHEEWREPIKKWMNSKIELIYGN